MKFNYFLLTTFFLAGYSYQQVQNYFSSNIVKLNEYTDENAKEFYIQNEINKLFTNFSISLRVDFVNINNQVKPSYDQIYARQEFMEPKEFFFNKELLVNSFKSGYYDTSEYIQSIDKFPYRQDNRPFMIDQLDQFKELSGNHAQFKFYFQEVLFNSKLNEALKREFERDEFNQEIAENVIISDHILSGRQYVYYLIDCDTLKCPAKLDQFTNWMNEKYSSKFVIKKLNFKNEFNMINEINDLKRRIQIQFDDSNLFKLEDENLFFKQTLKDLQYILKTEYFPKVTHFKFESSVYQFESPLNFLMIKSDFREFLRNFYQIESLLQYSLRVYIDAIFSISLQEDKIDLQHKKHELAQYMLGQVFQYMNQCIEILKEYHHLVEHDSLNCYTSYSIGCFLRKYGATLITLVLLLILGYKRLEYKLESLVKINSKKII